MGAGSGVAGGGTGVVAASGKLVMAGGSATATGAGLVDVAVTAALASAVLGFVLVGFGAGSVLADGGGVFLPQLRFNEMTHAKAAVIEMGTAKDVFFM